MEKDNAILVDYNKLNFERIAVNVRVKAGTTLKARIRAKWYLISWGDGVFTNNSSYTFEETGFHYISIIANRITWLNIDEWNATDILLDRCPFLARLKCQGNKLKSLNLQNCPYLVYVDCSNNDLEYVSVGNRKILKVFKANNNKLKVVDFSGCYRLKDIDLNNNDIYLTIIRGCKKLEDLCFDDAKFNVEEYTKETDDFPAVVTNEGGSLMITGEKELIERGKKNVEDLRKH